LADNSNKAENLHHLLHPHIQGALSDSRARALSQERGATCASQNHHAVAAASCSQLLEPAAVLLVQAHIKDMEVLTYMHVVLLQANCHHMQPHLVAMATGVLQQHVHENLR
jgi:hypothetical protein